MSVFIELVTDAFAANFQRQAAAQQNSGGGSRSSRAGKVAARRPVRGIEIKDDTYAYIKVVQSNGTEIPVMDSSSSTGTSSDGYTNFILQSVQEQRMERHQVIETFGDNYVFFFGESPRFLDCSAILVSTHDFSWRAEWWNNYENFWRGTKLVERGARAYLAWDDIIVEGYMVQAAAVEQAEQPYTIQMQFRFFVTKYRNVSLMSVQQFPVRQSVDLPPGVELTQSDAFSRLQAYYQGNSGASRAQDAVPREQAVIQNQAANNNLAQGSSISNSLRQLPPSALSDPSIWNALHDTSTFSDPMNTLNNQNRGPLRGLIADNKDEYINGSDGYAGARPGLQNNEEQAGGAAYDPQSATATAAQELPGSLPVSVINTLGALGVSANNPTVMQDMGLAPNFSPAYMANVAAFAQSGPGAGFAAGVGVGASTSFGGNSASQVSFSPLVNSSFSVPSGAGIGVSALAGSYAGNSSSYLHLSPFYQSQDPLGAIYGSNASQANSYNPDAYKYVEGMGAPAYGYPSPYGGPGYGQAGYGDFGGGGFGSGSADGDPGYLDPESVVASNAIPLTRPQYDMTALTPGPTLGTTLSRSASITVGGVSSAFSMTAFTGSFSDWVIEASQSPSPIYGQPATGPGFSGSYQPDVGTMLAQQTNYPVSAPYIGSSSSGFDLSSSNGFF
jgi:hypothetical protein